MLIDTHAHLTDERYDDVEKNIIGQMAADGLDRIVSVGYNYASSMGSFELSQKHDNIYCALGFHPSNTGEVTADAYDEILKLSNNKKVVAIGEIGLDYHYDDTDKPTQKRELLAQLELVKAANLPVMFHLRDAYEDMLKIVKENMDKMPNGGVMHCFSGSLETAREYVKLGFYISFSGTITFKNAKSYPDIIKSIPRDKILIETDCPYLAPTPFRGQTNYPKYVRYQAERIAEILGLSYEEVEEFTGKNAMTLYPKLV